MPCCSPWSVALYVVAALIILKLYVKLTTGWCRSQVCLVGKTAIVTGANTGIGYETALDLAKRGARVILACRNEQKAKEAKDKIIEETDNPNVVYKLVDFTSLKSVRKFAEDVSINEGRLDILVNNAGAAGQENRHTEDGLLEGMQSNYYGPFLLTVLLLDLLKKTGSSRIVNVASIAGRFVNLDLDKIQEFNDSMRIYCRSKLCNILFTIELARRLNGTTVTTYSLHPGAIQTELARKMPTLFKITWDAVVGTFFKISVEGAQTSIFCAVEKGIERYSGEHFHDCATVRRYGNAKDPTLQRRLWQKTEQLLKLGESQ